MNTQANLRNTLKHPSAFLPVIMSLLAVAVVMTHIVLFGTARQPDEGTAAHLWQLLMAGQVPIVDSSRSAGYPGRPVTPCLSSRCKQPQRSQHLRLFTFSTGEPGRDAALRRPRRAIGLICTPRQTARRAFPPCVTNKWDVRKHIPPSCCSAEEDAKHTQRRRRLKERRFTNRRRLWFGGL